MGYYTHFEISANPKFTQETVDEFIYFTSYEFDFNGQEIFSFIKWYEYREHMKNFSLKHPNTIYTVKGVGEDLDDKWMEYWKNGKSQNAYLRMEFDEFDENKLE